MVLHSPLRQPARPRRPTAPACLAAGLLTLAAAAASAQGTSPGELPKEGYKLPGGIEPVLHLRTYYFDQESLTGNPSTAWALGGWAGLRSPWWGDTVQLGVVGYTSQRLYGPQDKSGTLLLQSDQDAINVIGLAWAALRFAGQTFTAYRQLINRPFINPQDNRMVPNTFEAYTLSGAAGDFAYTGGYITRIKNRDADEFVWMSQDAGGSGSNKGVYFAGADWDFMKDGRVRADLQYGVDVYNTVYIDAKLPLDFDERTRLDARRAILSAAFGRRRADRRLLDLARGPPGESGARPLRRAPFVHAHRHRFRHAEPLRRPSLVPEPAAGSVQLGGRARLGHWRQHQLRRLRRHRADRRRGLCRRQGPRRQLDRRADTEPQRDRHPR